MKYGNIISPPNHKSLPPYTNYSNQNSLKINDNCCIKINDNLISFESPKIELWKNNVDMNVFIDKQGNYQNLMLQYNLNKNNYIDFIHIIINEDVLILKTCVIDNIHCVYQLDYQNKINVKFNIIFDNITKMNNYNYLRRLKLEKLIDKING